MKIHLLSDLHLEYTDFDPPKVDADILVLAGDIGNGLQGVEAAKKWASRYKYGVVYVAGNHEFYKQRWPSHIQAMRDKALGSNVHVLDNEVLDVQAVNTRFLGCTLWTDFCLYGDANEAQARLVARRNMNDYYEIRQTGELGTIMPRINPLDTQAAHRRSTAWLKEQLDQPYPGKTVVVTHHAPHARSIHPRFTSHNDALSPAFASNLDHLMLPVQLAPIPVAWLYGHTHYSTDFTVNGTRIVSNQRGYPNEGDSENDTFNPALVVEV